jgi:glycosyltransferase involved in cell wall biosynthesis
MTCTLILPCRDEAAALVDLLPRVPAVLDVIVVDNGSSDGTADVAAHLGARVVHEAAAGYGAAVRAGVLATATEYVAVMDGDGSLDPADVLPLLDDVASGRSTMAVGRRRPVAPGVWPWHARLGNRLVLGWMRWRLAREVPCGVTVRDIAPIRVCRREDLLALDLRERRFGYPVELLQQALRAGWRISERPVDYAARARGTRSKVSGSVRGTVRTARDFWRVLG